MNDRAKAANTLHQVTHHGRSLTACLDPAGSAYYKQLCFGTLRFYHRLEAILAALLQKPLKAKDSIVASLLFVALYELLESHTQTYAVVSETVSTCKTLKKNWAKGLVNGLLRHFLREKEMLLEKINQQPTAYYSHPNWFIQRLQQAYPTMWADILQANNIQAPLSLRINLQQQSRETYAKKLAENGIPATACSFNTTGLTLEKACDVLTLPGFAEGALSVQDNAAQLAATLLDVTPGQRVLDACAAPGGKTCHLLETEPSLNITAVDKDPARLEKVKENIARINSQATLIASDALDTATFWDGTPFERILLDAPCSASGVIRRHPDSKLLRKPNDILALQKLQKKLLHTLWPLLKPGGLLLYATCSVLPAENKDVVTDFLADTPDATLMPIDITLGQDTGAGLQILPGELNADGFFYAKLLKQVGPTNN